jgi:TIR domain
MRLFISWSGERSQQLAQALKGWLETHFEGHGIRVFVSSEIKKGSLWLPAVTAELQQAEAGLVCVTAKSLDSDWVLFEAGALSAAVALNTGEARIFTYLLGVEPAALPGPLSIYQSTVATKEDTLLLVNSLLGYLKRDQVGVEAFAPIWDDLWPKLQGIRKESVTSIFPGLAGLFDRKTFHEPVNECTNQAWFQRYDGAVATRDVLQAQKELVTAECDAQLADLYRGLVAAVDGYAMEMSASLFKKRTFNRADDGRLAIPPDEQAGLERRRLEVRQLVAKIIDRH